MTNRGSAGTAVRLIAACLVWVTIEQPAHAKPGDLDVTFGKGGIVTTSLGGYTIDLATALVRQPDGKLVAAGTYDSGGNDPAFAIVRFQADGQLDLAFGVSGAAIIQVGGGRDSAFAVALQPDGKIVAAGTASRGSTADFAIVRCNPDGSRDESFGGGGAVLTRFNNGSHAEAHALVIQPDEKLVAAGWFATTVGESIGLARYLPDGRLDTDFNTDGRVTTQFDGASYAEAQALLVQPDGKLVVAGFNNASGTADFALVRYLPNGALDNEFSGNGKVTTPVGGSDDAAYALALQPDGKLVAGGRAGRPSTDSDFALVRYLSDGRLDGTFSEDGKLTTPVSKGKDNVLSVLVQPDGKLVAGGYANATGTTDFALARYASDGSLDGGFGVGGIVTTQVGPGAGAAIGLERQPDGRLVAAGWSDRGTARDVTLARYLGDEWCGDGVVEGGEACDIGPSTGSSGTCCTAACTLQPAGSQCRPAAGPCDVADSCDGVQPVCPMDALRPAGFPCRPAAGICDVEETCTGASVACPGDAFRPPTTVCRPAAGVCDVPEACTGSTAPCPDDAFLPSSTTCRAARDVCDAAETCSGDRAACPDDHVLPPSVVCRQAAGPCDVAEHCSGVDVSCPADALAPSGTVCRGTAGVCDVAETCTGDSTACPADAVAPAGTVCRASAGACDAVEVCTGVGAACPADAFRPASTVCRDAAGACDIAEHCPGDGPACPADVFRPSTTVCRVSAGPCDVAESCTGTSAACPEDTFKAPGAVCRTRDGDCDLADTCNGRSAECPDAVLPAGASCPDDGDVCRADVCNGVDKACTHPVRDTLDCGSCHADTECDDANPCTADACTGGTCVHAPGNAGVVCRAAVAPCDAVETCDGSADACPPDLEKGTGDLCDDSRPETETDACDEAHECRGVTVRVDVPPTLDVPPDENPKDVKIPVSVEVGDISGSVNAKVVLQGFIDCLEPSAPVGPCKRAHTVVRGTGRSADVQTKVVSRFLPVTRRVGRGLGRTQSQSSVVTLPLTALGRRLFAKLGPEENARVLSVHVVSAIRDRSGTRLGAIFPTLLVRTRGRLDGGN